MCPYHPPPATFEGPEQQQQALTARATRCYAGPTAAARGSCRHLMPPSAGLPPRGSIGSRYTASGCRDGRMGRGAHQPYVAGWGLHACCLRCATNRHCCERVCSSGCSLAGSSTWACHAPGWVFERDDRPLLLQVPHHHCRRKATAIQHSISKSSSSSSRQQQQPPPQRQQQQCSAPSSASNCSAIGSRAHRLRHQQATLKPLSAPVPAAVQVPRMCCTLRFHARCVISGLGPAAHCGQQQCWRC